MHDAFWGARVKIESPRLLNVGKRDWSESGSNTNLSPSLPCNLISESSDRVKLISKDPLSRGLLYLHFEITSSVGVRWVMPWWDSDFSWSVVLMFPVNRITEIPLVYFPPYTCHLSRRTLWRLLLPVSVVSPVTPLPSPPHRRSRSAYLKEKKGVGRKNLIKLPSKFTLCEKRVWQKLLNFQNSIEIQNEQEKKKDDGKREKRKGFVRFQRDHQLNYKSTPSFIPFPKG